MAKKTEERKYSVTINNAEGTCNSNIFKKMAERGDITSESVKEHVGDTVKVDGYANCHIETTEKEFDVLYMSTNIGFIHTGSVVFIESFTDYYGDVDTFRIASIKTKNGTAYKAVPMLGGVMPVEDDDNTDELPFN